MPESSGQGKADRTQLAQLRTLLESLPQIAWLAGPNSEVQYFNRRWTDYTGSGTKGLTWQAYLHPEDVEPMTAAKDQALHDRADFEVTHRIRGRDGEYRWWLTRSMPLRDEHGRVVKCYGSATEISKYRDAVKAQREGENRLKLALERWARTLAERDATIKRTEALLNQQYVLLHEAGHRFKNSLQILSSLLSLQRNRIADKETQAQLDIARDRIAAIAKVHNRLYRLTEGGRIALHTFLRDLCHDIGRAIGDRCVVECEEIYLRTELLLPLALIVNEFLTNAGKYAVGGENPAVHVSCRTEGNERLLLSISDNGPGLPMGFDLDKSAGSGLQLVTTLLRQFGGRLDFESGREGTRFTVTLPLI